jgi:hypothetical protein
MDTKTQDPKASTSAETVKKAADGATSTPAKSRKTEPAKAGFFSQPDGATSKPSTALDIIAPSDGQIALTAHNDGDGTWSVLRGPGGTVLESGLAREAALAIVGGETGPYSPRTEQGEKAADHRRHLEEQTAELEVREIFRSDEEIARDGNALVGDYADNRPASGVSDAAGLGGAASGNGAS